MHLGSQVTAYGKIVPTCQTSNFSERFFSTYTFVRSLRQVYSTFASALRTLAAPFRSIAKYKLKRIGVHSSERSRALTGKAFGQTSHSVISSLRPICPATPAQLPNAGQVLFDYRDNIFFGSPTTASPKDELSCCAWSQLRTMLSRFHT